MAFRCTLFTEAKQKCRWRVPDRLLQYTRFTAHHACCRPFETHAHHNNHTRRTLSKSPLYTLSEQQPKTARNIRFPSQPTNLNTEHTLPDATAVQPPSSGDKCTRPSFIPWSSLKCNGQQTPDASSNGNWHHVLKIGPDTDKNACWPKK